MARFAGRKGTPNEIYYHIFISQEVKTFQANICVKFLDPSGFKVSAELGMITQVFST